MSRGSGDFFQLPWLRTEGEGRLRLEGAREWRAVGWDGRKDACQAERDEGAEKSGWTVPSNQAAAHPTRGRSVPKTWPS